MPTNITIKGIPDDVYNKLKQQAELHHRSVDSEVLVCITKAVQSNQPEPYSIIARARKLKEKAKGSLTMEQINEVIKH
ncbi:MAG TPA: DNA-binding protein [Bacteroidetes bacterium]|nr:DNA-binding protein [Bacteroidota bacterium]